MRPTIRKLLGVAFLLVLLAAACAGQAPAPAPAEEAKVEEAAPATEEPAAPPAKEKVRVRWFTGLGTGTDEAQQEPQARVVAAFNASQDEIELVQEVVDYEAAYDTFATQIAGGNAPDIVGPVGVSGRDRFRGTWLDLAPLIEKHGYDLSDFDESLVDFYHIQEEGQTGLPFAIFPSFVLYNKELFDEAGLAYPPDAYGKPYVDENGQEKEWNHDTIRELAMKLTVDVNGNDATSPDFDAENIVQFGYGVQWTDPRGQPTMFGSGTVFDEAHNAVIPDHWREAWGWYYQAMWEDGFYPNAAYDESDLLGQGNWFNSGNMAMTHIHLWYVDCCMDDLEADWDFAPVPSHQGAITAKLHADTFGIQKASKNPDAAFQVLTYLIGEGAPDLLKTYGGMPARKSLQEGYFERTWPDLDRNWQVVLDGIKNVDNPNHESWIPNYSEANARITDFWTRLSTEPGLNVDAEIDRLKADLQKLFEAAR